VDERGSIEGPFDARSDQLSMLKHELRPLSFEKLSTHFHHIPA
jgi:hypothetical protein